MAVTRIQKEKTVEVLVDELSRAGSIILTDFTGINVADMTELRSGMRENEVTFKVVKNTLLRRIFREMEISEDEDVYRLMEGPTALAYAGDEVIPIKMIKKFAEAHKGLPIVKGGLVSGSSYGVEELMKLAETPSREELLAKFMGSAMSPLQGFVTVSSGIIKKLLYALNAVKESKENQA